MKFSAHYEWSVEINTSECYTYIFTVLQRACYNTIQHSVDKIFSVTKQHYVLTFSHQYTCMQAHFSTKGIGLLEGILLSSVSGTVKLQSLVNHVGCRWHVRDKRKYFVIIHRQGAWIRLTIIFLLLAILSGYGCIWVNMFKYKQKSWYNKVNHRG